MPLEFTALTVGRVTVAKALSLWTGSNEFAQIFAETAASALSRVLQNPLARDNLRTQAQFCANQVAREVFEILNHEYLQVEPAARESILDGVRDAVESVTISQRLIAQFSNDAEQLTALLVKNFNKTGFGNNELQAAKKVLASISDTIINIARKLPNYSPESLSQLLSQNASLIETTTKILQEMRELRAISESAEVNEPWYEERYRSAIIKHNDKLQIIGLEDAPKKYSLTLAYIQLTVTHAESDDIETSWQTQDVDDETRLQRTVGVPSALSPQSDGASKTLILGDAGCGKTTLLQWLTVNISRSELPEPLSPWKGHTPFTVRLRSFRSKPLPSVSDFPKHAFPTLEPPEGWADRHFDSQSAVLLVDGVDEIPRQKRNKELLEWMSDLCEAYQHLPIVVTSRPVIQEDLDDWIDLGFSLYKIDRMRREQINDFVSFWHNATRPTIKDKTEREKSPSLEKKLVSKLDHNPDLTNIMESPLLCAVVCHVHRTHLDDLESSKFELYEKCVNLLVKGRDSAKELEFGTEYPKLRPAQRLAILQKIALWSVKQKQGLNEFGRTAALRITRSICKLMNGVDPDQASGTLLLLSQRSGVLREPVKNRYDFLHRTFQDFLAAKEIYEKGDVASLERHIEDDLWKDVITLAASKFSAAKNNRLVRTMLSSIRPGSPTEDYVTILAGTCCNTAIEIDTKVKQEAAKHIRRLIPPANGAAAQRLAPLGNMLAPHLAYNDEYTDEQCRQTVACLTAIGTSNSLQVASHYLARNHPSIDKELMRGWNAFDRKQYIEAIAQPLANRHNAITLNDVGTLQGIETIRGLASLTVEDSSDFFAGPISQCKDLKTIQMRRAVAEGVISSDTLEDLSLVDTKYELDLESIECDLKSISLRRIYWLKTLIGLVQFRRLEMVEIANCNNLESLEGLQDVPITSLTVSGLGPYVEWRPILKCTKLRKLTCLSSNPDIEVIETCKRRGIVVHVIKE